MKKMILFVTVMPLMLTSCAHHRDVRAGADGNHRVVIQTDDTAEGNRDALAQADHFCKEQGKYAAIVDEKKNYTGSMDEKSYNQAKTVSKVAQGVGGAAFVFGNKKASNAGGIVSLGGGIADSALGNGYTVEMMFVCK